MKRILIILVLLGLVVSCGTGVETTLVDETASPGPATDLPPTLSPTETPPPPEPTITPQPPTETATAPPPTATPLPLCVTLYYGGNAQFEIVSLSGQRVLVDVYDPEKLSGPVTERDVLLTTHTHWDHLNADFQAAFPGLQLFVRTGVLEAPGAIIQGIASTHNQGDPFKPEGGTNYIFVIEIGGLRIVHFGDIGQKALSEEQLTALGQVDIAITQLNNPYSEMNAQNAKGIHLMEQVRPRLIIPTHLNLDTAKLAVAQWPGWYSTAPSVQVCQSDLGEEAQILFLGEAAETISKYLPLAAWPGE
jgi:L-ascorbate metabolism protein UlaG (beta-lactamase superfamily)